MVGFPSGTRPFLLTKRTANRELRTGDRALVLFRRVVGVRDLCVPGIVEVD